MCRTIDNLPKLILHNPILEGEEKETADHYMVVYGCTGLQATLPNEEVIKSYIGDDDRLIISILENGEEQTSYKSQCKDLSWASFVEVCTKIEYSKEEKLEARIEIIKNTSNGKLNVYKYKCFSEDLKQKTIRQFLEIWNHHLGKGLTVVVHDEAYKKWETATIRFQSHTCQQQFLPVYDENTRKVMKERRQQLVYSDMNFTNLLPNDLYRSSNNDEADEIGLLFDVAYFYYALTFIFDFCTISSNNILYKINGFKTKEYTINDTAIGREYVKKGSIQILNEIYNWLYAEGSTYDKMIIARNIISVNLNDTDKIDFNINTFSAIQSNFRYFSKENARNFISLRNELSKILLEQENKIASYISDFSNDFKKSIMPSVTFFISIFAIRAISHQEIFDEFSPNLMWISIFLVVLAVISLIYSWLFEFNKKLHYAQRQIEEIRKRYEPLLTNKELDKLFYNDNDDKKLNCFTFARKQRCYTIIMWITCILLLCLCLYLIGVKSDIYDSVSKEKNTKTEIRMHNNNKINKSASTQLIINPPK